ncbi:MAG: heme-copper oxidase subunit III [Acidobacteriota bacterium]
MVSTARATWKQVPPTRRLGGGDVLSFRGGGDGARRRLPEGTVVMIGAWTALVPTLMLFLSLISAYIVRRGLGGGDWVPVPLPDILWVNTAMLLVSSAILERARRGVRAGRSMRGWILVAAAIGTMFLVGQIVAWRQLLDAGIGVGDTPYGSFFYVLSAIHAVHLVLGITGLIAASVWPVTGWIDVSRESMVRAASVIWHFLGILWLGLFLLMILWR